MLCAYQMVAMDRAEKEAAALEKAEQEQAKEGGAGTAKAAPYKDGEYTGGGEGYGGLVTMKVIIKNGRIDAIENVSAPGEDEAYWNMAKEIIPKMVEAQSPNVDTVSGATMSSTGIINGVVTALRKAVN